MSYSRGSQTENGTAAPKGDSRKMRVVKSDGAKACLLTSAHNTYFFRRLIDVLSRDPTISPYT